MVNASTEATIRIGSNRVISRRGIRASIYKVKVTSIEAIAKAWQNNPIAKNSNCSEDNSKADRNIAEQLSRKDR